MMSMVVVVVYPRCSSGGVGEEGALVVTGALEILAQTTPTIIVIMTIISKTVNLRPDSRPDGLLAPITPRCLPSGTP